jgi:hypothetical protein
MRGSNHLESRLWQVLEEERLADLPQYRRSGFFDEVPLYSRLAQVSFLADLGPRRANSTLLRFALKFLDALVAYEAPRVPFFAALTLWENSDDPLLVPNVFVCCGEVRKRLGGGLILHEGRSTFAAKATALLAEIDTAHKYQLLEDSSTLPGTPRVLIGYKDVPFPEMIRLESFRVKSVTARNRAQ